MSIAISDSTTDIVVTYNNDKGIPHKETITVGAVGELGVATLTVPATADAAQADFCILYSKAIDKSVGIWLDIDAAGTAPTSLIYSSTDYQVEVNIVTGGTAIQNAAALVLALAGETNFTGVTILDNLDGTITITQTAIGDISNMFGYANSNNSGDGSFLTTIGTAGLDGITQAEYIVLENPLGKTLAIWFDIDSDGTPPSGTSFSNADYAEVCSIDTGASATMNAAHFYTAFLGSEAAVWGVGVSVVFNADPTVTITHIIGADVTPSVSKNEDASGSGFATITVNTQGSAVYAARIDYYPKGGFNLIEDVRRNQLILNGYSTDYPLKGRPSNAIKFTDVSSPVVADLAALAAQIKTWESPAA